MIASHLPLWPVLLPLLAAPLCLLLRAPRAAWWAWSLAAAGSLAASALLLARTAAGEVLHYALGGWPAPFGIVYRIDAANALMLALLGVVAAGVALHAWPSVAREIPRERIAAFCACLCLCLAGLAGICATGDAFNLFVFLEISSLSGYTLIALGRRRQALLAAIRYLILGTVGGTFVLAGIGLAYALTGTLNMADMASRLAALEPSAALLAACALVTVGLAIKAAVVPLHGWLPGAYAEAPTAGAALLSGTGTKVALYALARLGIAMFGTAVLFGALDAGSAGLLLGSLGMVLGAAVACRQDELRRLLAWSSVAQIGYLVAALSLASPAGVSAAFLHMVAHGLIKAALFLLAGSLALRLGAVRLADLAGLSRRAPLCFALLVFGGLGLIGVPSTAGFVGKWALVLALVEAGRWGVLAAVVVSSLLAVVYVWRIVEQAFFTASTREEPLPRLSATESLALAVLSLASLAIGLGLLPLGAAADAAAAALLGGVR